MKEKKFRIDNRDTNTTWLVMDDDSYVEVDIFELIENSIENNIEDEEKKETLLSTLNYLNEEL